MNFNWNEIREFFESPVLSGKIPGVDASNVGTENRPFEVGEKKLWVEIRVAETESKTRTEKTLQTSGVAVYTVCVPPNVGSKTLENVVSQLSALFSPLDPKRGIFRGRGDNRIVVRRVERVPAMLIDPFYKKNVRVFFDCIYAK